MAPYKTILMHGFVLDGKGNKMSKSLGNVIDPLEVISGGKGKPAYGADVLRVWAATSAYFDDVQIDTGVLKQAAETYRKLRGTLRFLLGGLAGFDPQAQVSHG